MSALQTAPRKELAPIAASTEAASIPSSSFDGPVIRIRVFPDPLIGLSIDIEVCWGSTIAEIVASIPLDPRYEARRAHFAVRLGEHEVCRDIWHRVRPSAYARHRPVTLVVYLAIHGGGGGNTGRKLLSLVAAVALIGISLFTAGGGFGFLGGIFAQGQLGAQLLAGAVTIGGSLLIQGLLAPPKPATDTQDAVGFASAQNSFSPGQQLQRVMGTQKVAPAQVIPPFTTIDDGTTRADGTLRYSQFVTQVFALAGAHQIGTVYIGDVDSQQMVDVTVETRWGLPGDTHLTLVTDTRAEEQTSLELSSWIVDPDQTTDGVIAIDGTILQCAPQWHIVETRDNPDSFRIEFLMSQGLWYHPGNNAACVVLKLQMQQRNADGSWAGWNDLGNLVMRAWEPNDAIRVHLVVVWVDAYPAGVPNAWPAIYTDATNYKGFVQYYGAAGSTEGGAPVAGWHWESAKRVYLYLLKSPWPIGRYQFQIKRSLVFASQNWNSAAKTCLGVDPFSPVTPFTGTPPAGSPVGSAGTIPQNPSFYSSDIVIPTVQSIWNEYPIADDGEAVTLIAVRAKNRQVQTVSVIATGLCPDWNGTEWVDLQPTSNPASWYRHVLADVHNSEPVDPQLIDFPALQDWHQWCASTGHRIDAIVQGKSVIDTLKQIALGGFAAPVFGAQFSIIPERARSAPVGLITQRNASNFGWRKPFTPEIHALRVTFQDRFDLYRAKEIIVYAPGYSAVATSDVQLATRYEAVTYDGITSLAEATARANLDIAWALRRSTLHTFTMDIEHLEFRRGDLVLMETDILGQMGGRGRVKSLNRDGSGAIVSLVLDEIVDFGSAQGDLTTVPDLTLIADLYNFSGLSGCAIRLANGAILVEQTITASDPQTLLFASPLAMPVSGDTELIGVGTLIATGELAQVAREILIWDIAPSQDLTADITAVDYASAIFYGA